MSYYILSIGSEPGRTFCSRHESGSLFFPCARDGKGDASGGGGGLPKTATEPLHSPKWRPKSESRISAEQQHFCTPAGFPDHFVKNLINPGRKVFRQKQ